MGMLRYQDAKTLFSKTEKLTLDHPGQFEAVDDERQLDPHACVRDSRNVADLVERSRLTGGTGAVPSDPASRACR